MSHTGNEQGTVVKNILCPINFFFNIIIRYWYLVTYIIHVKLTKVNLGVLHITMTGKIQCIAYYEDERIYSAVPVPAPYPDRVLYCPSFGE